MTDNHLTVIQRSCPGGIPDQHRQAILAAARQLSTQQSFALQHAPVSAHSAPPKTSLIVALGAQPGAPAVEQEPAQQGRPAAAVQTQAARLADSSVLGSSWSSYTSAESSQDDLDSTEADSRTSTLQISTAASAVSQPQHGEGIAVDDASRPAPSRHQLQELYSQMEADYKKLQERPAQARAAVKQQAHVATQETDTASSPAAGGGNVPDSVQRAPKVVVGSGYGQAALQARAMPPKRLEQRQGQQQGNATAAKPTGVADNVASGASGRLGAAVALKQMKKGKKSWPDEPFVQVFTNFHTLEVWAVAPHT